MTHFKTLAIGALTAVALAATTAASAAPRVDGRQTLTLLSVQDSFTTVPPISRASPPAIGVRMIFNDVLYNRGAQFGKPAGAQVGTADNVCTLVSKTSLQCTLIAHLPNGQIVATGSVRANAHTTNFAITGGVGAYADVRGSARGHDLSQSKTVVVLTLS